MSHRIIIHTCLNARDQKLVIYSQLCENFYRVAGYHSDGRLLFDGNIIEFHEVGHIVSEFTGKSIRYDRNHNSNSKPKAIPTETVIVRSRKRGRPVGYRKSKPSPVQVTMPIPDVPVHPVKVSKPLSQKDIDKRLRLILKEVV